MSKPEEVEHYLRFESEQLELPFEAAPGSIADLDYTDWQGYLDWCEANEVKPTTKDYTIWLDEANERSST